MEAEETAAVDLGAGYLALLGAAFALGVLHALEPGHGKGIMGAYLVASRGGIRHAAWLGLVVAVTHTVVVFVMAAAALAFEARFRGPETIRWLENGSAVLVICVGAWMALRAFDLLPRRHGHVHPHDAVLPPGRNPLGFWTLAGVGAAGGLAPCPAALTAFLAALKLGEPARGLGVVVALSAGIAAALIVVGMLFVKARGFVERNYVSRGWLAKLPRASAALIIVLGLAMLATGVATRTTADALVVP